jgi:hypothetical protein
MSIISGQSRDIIIGETAEIVVEKTINHWHFPGVDGGSLRANIRACVKQRETPPGNYANKPDWFADLWSNKLTMFVACMDRIVDNTT